MARAYTTNSNNSYLFLTDVLKNYETKIKGGQEEAMQIETKHDLNHLDIKIESFMNIKKHLEHAIQEIEAITSSIQRLAEIDTEDYQKELKDLYDPIANNTAYFEAFRKAKMMLVDTEDIIQKLNSTRVQGAKLIEEIRDQKQAQEQTSNNTNNELLKSIKDSFEGMASSINSKINCNSLKTFTLPTFNGKPEHFTSYWGRFKRTVDENDDYDLLEKVNLLCEGLSGEALDLIQGIEPSVHTYETIKETLVEEYGVYTANKVQLINNLKKIKRAQLRADDCLKTLREVKIIVRQLQAAGSNISPEFFISDVASKFPYKIIRSIVNNKAQDWEVDELMKTITANVKDLIMKEQNEGLFRKDTVPEKTSESKWSEKRGEQKATKTPEEKKVWPCVFCKDTDHRSHQCTKVENVEKKRLLLKKENRCWLCFSPTHKSSECKREKCHRCKGDHSPTVCLKGKESGETKEKISTNVHLEPDERTIPSAKYEIQPVLLSQVELFEEEITEQSQVLLRMAESHVLSNITKTFKPVKILIDEGSMRSFIKADVAKSLGLPHSNEKIRTYYGIGGMESSHISSEAKLIFHTKNGSIIITKMITKPCLTAPILSPQLVREDKEFIRNNKLILANTKVDGEIFEPDIILGMDRYRLFMKLNEEIELPSKLTLKNSVFGYLIHGSTNVSSHVDTPASYTTIEEGIGQELESLDMVRNIFEIESLGISTDDFKLEQTNNYFKLYSSKIILEKGRIIAPLPLKTNINQLKSNYHPSLFRLKSLWSKIQSNPEQLKWYKATFQDYVDKGIIERVPTEDRENAEAFYLPHHGVWKAGKPKPLRIVFDGSAKQKGSPSLNEAIHTGLSYVNKIHDIIILCRLKPIIITCDIESAFLQIELEAEHRDFCRFLWVKDLQTHVNMKNIEEFRFKRLPFGLTASPSILNMCLTWFLSNSQLEIAKEILQCLYVDNIILFADDAEEAKQKCELVKDLFKEISMNVRQFLCNNETVTQSLPKEDQYPMSSISILGIPYDPKVDTIGVDLDIGELATHTKRGLLQHLHSLYDPIGIVNPLTIKLKLIFREICDKKYEWDEVLPVEITKQWEECTEDIQTTMTIQVKRAFNFPMEKTELWVFADASETALACCAYFKYEKGSSYILSGKSRLAPRSKNITIPRLELLAIRLATRLAMSIHNLIPTLKRINIVSDSTIALSWITNGKPLPPYVTHQVDQIHLTINAIKARNTPVTLYHVDTKMNPADIGSRGGNMKQLFQSYWMMGPIWLNDTPTVEECPHLTRYEMKNPSFDIQLVNVDTPREKTPLEYNLSYKESHYANMRVLVKLGKIVRIWTKKVFPDKELSEPLTELSTNEVANADDIRTMELLLTKQAQQGLKIKDLESKHMGFTFFSDIKNLIRIQSRLQNAPLPYETKNPIYLPRESPFTKHLIMHFHRETHHQGKDFVAIRIRQEYYVDRPSQTKKRVIRDCVVCRRFHALPYGCPNMPSLPKDRVTITKPFINTGCDLMGPISLKDKEKVYVCLFTCMTTRAVHLELVFDQSAKAFMNAFNRFISRRGVPEIMRSDCAGNFTLSSKMIEIFEDCNDSQLTTEGLISYFATKKIRWLFNTPLAPWKGGCWERLVGITKLALKKAIGKRSLALDDFVTMLTKVEAIVNTRPLTHPDPNDLERLPIRPIDFLSPVLSFSLPDNTPDTRIYDEGTDIPTIQTVEQAIEAIQLASDVTSRFWTIFLKEYLIYLKDIYKHTRNQPAKSSQTPQTGEVVIIQEDSLPRASWKLGRILELIKSSDEEIRSAKVKTGTGNIVTRSLNQLFSLEIKAAIKAPINSKVVKTNTGKYKTTAKETEPEISTDILLQPYMGEESTGDNAIETTDYQIENDFNEQEQTPQDIPTTEAISDPQQHADHLRRWWMPERMRKARNQLRARGELPVIRGRATRGFPKINPKVLMICGLITSLIKPTEASEHHCDKAKLLTIESVANPHCDEIVSVATVMIPLIAIITLIACVCRIAKGQKEQKTWSEQIKTSKNELRERLKLPVIQTADVERGDSQSIQRDENAMTESIQQENRKAPQLLRMGSRLSLLMIMTIVSTANVEGCQSTHARHSTEIICLNRTNCYKEYTQDFIASAKSKKFCLEYKFKNQSVGAIEVEVVKTLYKCIPTIDFFTIDSHMKLETANRCSSMGSCNDSCDTISPKAKINELEPYKAPYQVGCGRSCGFVFCGCGTWSDSCTFYKLEHIPKNEITYKIITCENWDTEIELNIKTKLFSKNDKTTIRLQPYETYKHLLFNLTIVSHYRPPIYGLHRSFAISKNQSFIINKESIMVRCQSAEQAGQALNECSASKRCDCSINRDNEAVCHCPFHEFTTKSNQLPLTVFEGTIAEEGDRIVIEPKFEESKITLESTMSLEGHTFTYDFPCHLKFNNITGCYACNKGAQASISCISSRETWISLQCYQNTYMIKCDASEPTTSINYASKVAYPQNTCTTVCANNLESIKIEGTLHWETEKEGTASVISPTRHKAGIDLNPIMGLFRNNWKFTFLLVGACLLSSATVYVTGAHLLNLALKLFTQMTSKTVTAILNGHNMVKSLLKEPCASQVEEEAL